MLRRSQSYWSENSVSVRTKTTILLKKNKAEDYFIFHFYYFFYLELRTKATISLKKKMLRIIFYLRIFIILSNGISNFKKDKAKDEPEKPIGDHFIDKMKTMNENCSEDMEQVIGFF